MNDPCFSPSLRWGCIGSCLQRPGKKEMSRLGRDTIKSGRRDSNPRHPAWEASALPTELRPRTAQSLADIFRMHEGPSAVAFKGPLPPALARPAGLAAPAATAGGEAGHVAAHLRAVRPPAHPLPPAHPVPAGLPRVRLALAAGRWPLPPQPAARDGGPPRRSARQRDRSPDRSAANRPSAAPADP